MSGKPNKNAIYLTDEEYNTLSSLSKKKSSCKTLKCRCHVLMDLDNNHGKRLTYSQSARANGVCPATVSNITKLYRDGGINAVIALKRNVNSDNARRKMDGRAEARIIEIACSPAPEGHSRWTLRMLEDECKIVLEEPVSKETIRTTLKKRTATSPEQILVYPQKGGPRIHSLHGGRPRCI